MQRDHTSPSQITMFYRCPRQFQYRYLMGKIIPPGVSMVVGTAVHEGAAKYLSYIKSKCESDPDHMINGAIQAATDSLSSNLPSAIDDKFERTDAERYTVKLVKDYPHTVGKMINMSRINTIEETMSVDLGVGIPMVFKIDVSDEVDGRPRVCDLKVTRRIGTAKSHHITQMRLYSVGWYVQNKAYPLLRLDYYSVKPSDKSVHCPAGVTSGEKEHERMIERIRDMEDMIRFGTLPRNEEGWQCNPQWCGYYNECILGKSRGMDL